MNHQQRGQPRAAETLHLSHGRLITVPGDLPRDMSMSLQSPHGSADVGTSIEKSRLVQDRKVMYSLLLC
jgi:hypothetical protein